MKKLFALVMVLAMALAIAVPALASGWDQIPTDPKTVKDISISITALEVEPNTSVLGELYEQLAVMYPVVKGTEVHFFVEIYIPAQADLSDANWLLLASKGLKYKMAVTSNLTLDAAYNFYIDGAKQTAPFPAYVVDAKNATFAQAQAGHTYGFEYTAEGNKAGDAVCSAKIGFYNTWTTVAPFTFAWDNNADGKNEFIVTHAADLFTVAVNGGTDAITFPVDDANGGKIDTSVEMTITAGTPAVTYFVNRAVNGDITFRTAGGVVTTPSDTGYATIKATFDKFFTALGFGYADAKYMTQAHFETYFGTIAETTVKITYPSGAVVVAPPTVEPPQTGDATTVVGFVMIALALVAAAAVTVKKVRA